MENQKIKYYLPVVFSGIMICCSLVVSAFCGFYVAPEGAELFNDKSAVILARHGQTTTVTMSSDVKGDIRNFAMVVPVPVVPTREQIRLADGGLFRRLNQYSKPRMVEYFDANPCSPPVYLGSAIEVEEEAEITEKDRSITANNSVTIEARYEVGEYDILILSAAESKGLKFWLTQNQYQIPQDAEDVLDPYIKDGLKFFVVKVNLKRLRSTATDLRPIQITYESPRFMLPIRLGMANADGDQDMIVYVLTAQGRVESTNYQTVEIPTNRDIPVRVKGHFEEFYEEVFDQTWNNAGKNVVITEYAWDVTPTWGGAKCDPCAGPAPMQQELIKAGVSWIQQKQSVFFTRLRVRYNRQTFPQDLQFIETSNRSHFQGRYVITHPATGDLSCEDGRKYLASLSRRQQREEAQYALLTGREIRRSHEKVDPDQKGTGLPLAIEGPHFGNWLKMCLMIVCLGLVYILINGLNRLSELKSLS